ncbi:unnamed protein product [Acanthosepion pharaonis]|uniref:Uncharacterized protein n=1 Tax=Acanthosepion pharaonis TaxID=158019 RepID=A0A812D4L9_ACAPH|nr:unnamed protein product [Sepia pharaonis]
MSRKQLTQHETLSLSLSLSLSLFSLSLSLSLYFACFWIPPLILRILQLDPLYLPNLYLSPDPHLFISLLFSPLLLTVVYQMLSLPPAISHHRFTQGYKYLPSYESLVSTQTPILCPINLPSLPPTPDYLFSYSFFCRSMIPKLNIFFLSNLFSFISVFLFPVFSLFLFLILSFFLSFSLSYLSACLFDSPSLFLHVALLTIFLFLSGLLELQLGLVF